MISFAEYLAEARRGVKPKRGAGYDRDVEYLRAKGELKSRHSPAIDVNRWRNDLLGRIRANDAALADEMKDADIEELDRVVADRKLERREKDLDWKRFEKDVGNGVQEMFDSGFFVKADGTPVDKFWLRSVGGGTNPLESDVSVENRYDRKKFSVECKLTYETAGYFKYSVDIVNGRFKYDYGRYIDYSRSSTLEQAKELILHEVSFMDDIDIEGFLNGIANSKDVVASWRAFNANLVAVSKFIKTSEQFSGFASEVTGRFDNLPKDFGQIIKVFDKYYSFYKEKYNQIIGRIFELITDKDLAAREKEFVIGADRRAQKSGELKTDVVFSSVDALSKAAAEIPGSVSDQKEFTYLIDTVKRIEQKFFAITSAIGKPNSCEEIERLKETEKLSYFFKAFISGSGRKHAGEGRKVPGIDELGNMLVCNDVLVEDGSLGRMITEFYVNTDGCAYIQVRDRVYIFDERFNPLGLQSLPLFKDAVTKFRVAVRISDKLSRIFLDIRAVEPEDSVFAGKAYLSFRKSDSNYVAKKLGHIRV